MRSEATASAAVATARSALSRLGRTVPRVETARVAPDGTMLLTLPSSASTPARPAATPTQPSPPSARGRRREPIRLPPRRSPPSPACGSPRRIGSSARRASPTTPSTPASGTSTRSDYRGRGRRSVAPTRWSPSSTPGSGAITPTSRDGWSRFDFITDPGRANDGDGPDPDPFDPGDRPSTPRAELPRHARRGHDRRGHRRRHRRRGRDLAHRRDAAPRARRRRWDHFRRRARHPVRGRSPNVSGTVPPTPPASSISASRRPATTRFLRDAVDAATAAGALVAPPRATRARRFLEPGGLSERAQHRRDRPARRAGALFELRRDRRSRGARRRHASRSRRRRSPRRRAQQARAGPGGIRLPAGHVDGERACERGRGVVAGGVERGHGGAGGRRHGGAPPRSVARDGRGSRRARSRRPLRRRHHRCRERGPRAGGDRPAGRPTSRARDAVGHAQRRRERARRPVPERRGRHAGPGAPGGRDRRRRTLAHRRAEGSAPTSRSIATRSPPDRTSATSTSTRTEGPRC